MKKRGEEVYIKCCERTQEKTITYIGVGKQEGIPEEAISKLRPKM